MILDAVTGLIKLDTGAGSNRGSKTVTINATDANGPTSQTFTLSVFGSRAVASALIRAANGGVISVNDPASTIYGLSINIPAGALPGDTTINIAELLAPPTLGGTTASCLKGLSVEPDGISLAIPATVTVPYSTSDSSKGKGYHSRIFSEPTFWTPRPEAWRGWPILPWTL